MKGVRDVLAVAKASSSNRKIGDAAATYAAQVSCPEDCVFYAGGGCYAESGALGNFVTAPLNAEAKARGASALDVARAEARAIDGLMGIVDRPLRLHGVGDCKTNETAKIVAAACERYMDRGGGQVWTYTHAWRTVDRDSWGRVSVLASCETPIDVAMANMRRYATALVVDEFPGDRRYTVRSEPIDFTSLGMGHVPFVHGVIPCPQQTRGVACTDCRLCFDDQRLLNDVSSIGFSIHGTALAVKKARMALDNPGDPNRKLTSRDFIHSFLARTKGEWPTMRQVQDGAGVSSGSAWEMLNKMREEAKREGRDRPAA